MDVPRSQANHGDPAWPSSACSCRWSKSFSTTSAALSAASPGIYQRHDFADEKRAALDAWAQHLLTLDLVEREPRVAVAKPLRSRVMA